jgi:hypothetical protein
MPAFYGPWRVVMRGNKVHVVASPIYARGMPLPEHPRRLYGDALIDATRAQRVKRLITQYVVDAPNVPMGGADGMYYQIQAGGHCAMGWLRSDGFGADRLFDIGSLLALRASRGGARDAGRSERAIDILLESFEHGDGSELLDYGAPRREPAWMPETERRWMSVEQDVSD